MAYPEKLLANDEKVVEHLHPHWITLVPATLWFLVLCAAAGAGVYFAPDHGKMTAISFRPTQDFDAITWTGPLTKPTS